MNLNKLAISNYNELKGISNDFNDLLFLLKDNKKCDDINLIDGSKYIMLDDNLVYADIQYGNIVARVFNENGMARFDEYIDIWTDEYIKKPYKININIKEVC